MKRSARSRKRTACSCSMTQPRRSARATRAGALALGASCKGRGLATFGLVTATSFFPAKPLGCFGDGGAIFTDDAELAADLRSVRVHGQGFDKYDNVRLR